MKKSIFSTLALSAMTLCSCMSEEEMFQPLDNSLATIELNISNNEELNVSTRAAQAQNVSDLTQWYAQVGENPQTTADQLQGKTYKPGSYNITVSSHTSLEAALANDNNSSAGAPYYTANDNVTLNAGTNLLTFNCGTAKNSKITVDWSGTNGVEGLTFNNVKATQDGRTYTYTDCGTTSKYAFFAAGEGKSVSCVLNYTFNGESKTISKTINTTATATNYKLTIKANSNGTITTITINYDDTFSDGGTTSVTIDAATGEEEKKS